VIDRMAGIWLGQATAIAALLVTGAEPAWHLVIVCVTLALGALVFKGALDAWRLR
jgi:hypothetical protein